MLAGLRESHPEYDMSIVFMRVDWDTYRRHEVTKSRKIPRRSTFVLIKDGKEAGRLVAVTSEARLKALLDQALPESKTN